jgi:hypothetical protein
LFLVLFIRVCVNILMFSKIIPVDDARARSNHITTVMMNMIKSCVRDKAKAASVATEMAAAQAVEAKARAVERVKAVDGAEVRVMTTAKSTVGQVNTKVVKKILRHEGRATEVTVGLRAPEADSTAQITPKVKTNIPTGTLTSIPMGTPMITQTNTAIVSREVAIAKVAGRGETRGLLIRAETPHHTGQAGVAEPEVAGIVAEVAREEAEESQEHGVPSGRIELVPTGELID